jgi:indolepyruvate ferredoxin oxidoreductase alpha subunit
MRIGCPAILMGEDKRPRIDGALCVGCGLCAGMCRFGAIGKGDAL